MNIGYLLEFRLFSISNLCLISVIQVSSSNHKIIACRSTLLCTGLPGSHGHKDAKCVWNGEGSNSRC
jgi:hypothetical protein